MPNPRSHSEANTPPHSARDSALRVIAQHVRRFPDLEPLAIDERSLSPKDAGLANAIVDAVLRHWLSLEFIAARFSSRPWNSLSHVVRAAILAGTAQLLVLDRIPPHAALHETVEWIKRESPKASGLVNAILRRVSELKVERLDGLTPDSFPLHATSTRSLAVLSLELPPDPLAKAAVLLSHPEALLRAWATDFGQDEAVRLAFHSHARPPITLNVQWASDADLAALELTPHSTPGHAVTPLVGARLATALNEHRGIWVQDAAAGMAVRSIAHLTPRVVLDACAGQGTKTRQLAATFPNARILATDVDHARLSTLSSSTRHLPNVTVIAFDTLRDHAGTFDLILLDVPCTNTGVLARRTEARYRTQTGQLDRLASIQEGLIKKAFELLASGRESRVVYSTCSIDPRENLERVEQAQHRLQTPIELESHHLALPVGGPGEPPHSYRDGSFSAILRRR
ncbi:MAG: hypothetical protein IPK69_11105 [Phycisphaerales bacterium]|nr:MAG: hypothetical protein IPK69_11105 [Phycisphaerales bacterium]